MTLACEKHAIGHDLRQPQLPKPLNRYHAVLLSFNNRKTSSPLWGRLAPGLGLVESIRGNRTDLPLPPTARRVISTSRLSSNLVTSAAMAYPMARLARKRPGHRV